MSERDEIERLRAEVAALKAERDPLAEMWAALADYQEQADADGHGESWRRMCEERTLETARAAAGRARGAPRARRLRAAWALEAAYAAANQIAEGCAEAEAAIAAIRKAKEVRS